jgi:hypothetical protein
MIQCRYRRDYAGEFVILETRYANGEKQQTREWIENPISNQHISNRAVVIGSNTDREQFDYRRLQRHRGGLLAKKRLQTYGSGTIWNEMPFDFFVSTDRAQIKQIIATEYDTSTVVYSNSKICIENPEHLYLVPYTPYVDQLALAIYLAAFDGHEEIFLLGYNQTTPTLNQHLWIEHVNHVMRAYTTTKFYLVGVKSNMPTLWRENRNVGCITYRRFVSYCDV